MLLLQEFLLEIKDKLGAKNLAADHVSVLETGKVVVLLVIVSMMRLCMLPVVGYLCMLILWTA